MQPTSIVKRWLAVAMTGGLFAAILGVVACNGKQTAVATSEQEQAKDKDKDADKDKSKDKDTGKSADWWMYGGTLQRNFVNLKDTGIPQEWDVEKGTNVLWSVELGSMAYGGPIVSGGKIFVGTNNANPRNPKITGDKGVLQCFRESDGKFLWQAVHDKLQAGRVQDWPMQGICSSPVVEGKRLWYVNNRCELICADVEGDGKEGPKFIWTLDMIGKLGVFPHNLAVCSPLLLGDNLYVVTANGVDEGHINVPSPNAPSFICVSKDKGEVVWQKNYPSESLVEAKKKGGDVAIKDLINRGELLMHGQWSNPSYAEPKGKPMVIFPGGDGWLYALNPKDGAIIWKFDCNPKDSQYVLGGKGTRNDFIATPVVVGDQVFIAVGQDPEHKEGVGHLYCIDITKEGDISPTVVTDASVFPPKTKENPNSAQVWHYGGVGQKGVPWLFGRSMSTCAIHEGLLYVADLGGVFYCFEAKTGKKLWDHNMESATWSSPYWVDGKIFMSNDDGKMYVFQHGKEKKILAEFEMNCRVRTTPIACNGVFYLMTENPTKLYAIKKK